MKVNRKKIILFYITLCLSLIAYLFYYIDSQFNMIDKFLFSKKINIELFDFDKISNDITYFDLTKSKLIEKDDMLFLKVDGFSEILIEKSNKNLFRRKGLHPTEFLSLYSMVYLTDYYVKHYKDGTLNTSKIDNIEKAYMMLSKEILNYFSINGMIFNDHAVADRVEFLSLMIPYIKKFYPERINFISNMQKDFNISMGFLMSDKYFTWSTNHGLMQIRSLGNIINTVKDKKIRDKIISIYDERLLDVIHYFTGEDGEIYESATGYWSYIYSLFDQLLQQNSVQNCHSISELHAVVNKTKRLLNYVAANDGFIQGVGDSYSFYINSEYKIDVPKNRVFRYSNNFAGLNYTSDSINVNILFSSLFTPPNIHKLPEDLSLYIYLNQPLFVNTATYSYNNSVERKHFVEHETAHSTVYFKDEPNVAIESSNVIISQITDSVIVFKGNKYYPNNRVITRTVTIRNNSLEICDFSNQAKEIISQFNLSNHIYYKILSRNQLSFLTDDSLKIELTSSSPIILNHDAIISEKPQDLSKIDQARIIGDTINIKINIPKINIGFNAFETFISKQNSAKRLLLANNLKFKYKDLPKVGFKKGLIVRLYLSVLIFALFVVVNEILFFKFKTKRNKNKNEKL